MNCTLGGLDLDIKIREHCLLKYTLSEVYTWLVIVLLIVIHDLAMLYKSLIFQVGNNPFDCYLSWAKIHKQQTWYTTLDVMAIRKQET